MDWYGNPILASSTRSHLARARQSLPSISRRQGPENRRKRCKMLQDSPRGIRWSSGIARGIVRLDLAVSKNHANIYSCDYLPQRYPSLYKKTSVGMNNLFTGESFNIVERPLTEDPMQMAARMVQDDLAIMFEKEDGQYYLLAGAILLAGFWRIEDKFGMPLSEIH